MVLAPNDLFSWHNNTMKHNSCNGYVTLLPPDAQWHLLCAWSSLEAVMEPSSSFSDILVRLLSSPVQTQLMLIVPHWGPGAPKVESSLLGSAHTSFPGSRTVLSKRGVGAADYGRGRMRILPVSYWPAESHVRLQAVHHCPCHLDHSLIMANTVHTVWW